MSITTRIVPIATALVVGAALAPAAVAADRWIPAAKDPLTGAVVPIETLVGRPTGNPPTASVTRTGKVQVTITTSIRSALPSALRPMCFVTISHGTTSGSTFMMFRQTDGVLATRSGTIAKCTVTVPFAWADPTVANKIQTTVEVTSNVGRLASKSQTLARSATIDLPPLAFPVEGGTRAVSLATAL